ncbi:MAG: NAD-binding protein [Firmicutes bacterium]|nr:NAD-binding protein [Bacillota bacterium]
MVGFIGLGIMGKPMAKHLLHGLGELAVFDLQEGPVRELTDLGAVRMTPQEMAKQCGTIHCILPAGSIVQDVLFGADGILDNAGALKIVCDHSSVTPGESRVCAEKLAEKGISFVDCPVSGGEPKAIDGTLAFMAGGTQEAFDALKPHFEAMGSSAVLVGDVGSGSVAKLVNQVIVNLNIAAVSEAFVLCEKAGADPGKVYEAIRGGLAGSTVLDAKMPKILAGDFAPGGTIKVNRKDINNVLSTAHACECPMPLSSQLFEIMQYLSVHGHLMDDHSGIVQYFEDLAGVEVRKH